MTHKWVGAILILMGCGGFGFTLASNCRKEVLDLQQLTHVLQFMEWELQYRLTPLPDLCRQAGLVGKGVVRTVFVNLSKELNAQYAPDVCSCMTDVLKQNPSISGHIRRQLLYLSKSLGRFEIAGQIEGLQAVRSSCEEEIMRLNTGKEVRMRSYRTLGLCAGAALIILFI
jgi:stage III sporulation protein AB